MAPSNDAAGRSSGFEGEVAGLSLPDVIQLNGGNRFSGCVTVQYGTSSGLVFFREGEVVHAEQGGHSGEEAFYDIMEWRAGRFTLQPNVATTSRTIHKSVQHLLIEAHRVLDERRAGRGSAPPPRPGEPRASGLRATLQRVTSVSGVAYAALVTEDGKCVEDRSFEGETLAGQVAYLAMMANQLGAVFRAGQVQSAVVQGSAAHLLLLAAKSNHYLGVQVRGEAELGGVEAAVRRQLAAR
jgi:predicted regulator of Ras-like GTPase activity (Roadblock/LC7/MglB family)